MGEEVKERQEFNKQIMETAGSDTLKKTLAIFLPVFTLIAVVTVVILMVSESARMTGNRHDESLVVDVQAASIDSDIQHIFSDLALLAHRKEMVNLWNDDGILVPEVLEDLTTEFLTAMAYWKIYDQIRLIDEHGMEISRVNFNNGHPSIVSPDELQNKNNRYYFTDAFNLDQGEIFISPFDLNIEHGEVQQPLKPMIRFAIPVFDKHGIKRGIVLLNYFGSKLIERFTSQVTSFNRDQSMLLNDDGYWLVGINPEDEWGFMFEKRKDCVFQNTYPEAWEKIRSDTFGQFETSRGLFTFRTVFPLLKGKNLRVGSGETSSPSRIQLEGRDYYWKIVSFVPADVVYANQNNYRMNASLIVAVLSLVIFLGLWRVMKESAARRLASEGLQKREAQLRQIIDLVPHFIFVKDKTGKFEIVNKATAEVFGTTVEDLTGRRDEEFVATEEEMEHFRADDLEVINSGKTKIIPIEPMTDSENNLRYLQTTKVPFRLSDTNEVTLLGVAVDITERVQAEAALAEKSIYLDNILRSSTEYAIATTDLDFRITYYNPLAEQFFGYKAADVIGKTVHEMHIKERVDPERFDNAVENIRVHGEYRYQLVQESDEGKRFVNSRVSGIYNPANELVGFALFSIDVTEQMIAEEEQLKLKKLESVGILAGGIAHDFNNLLMALLGNMELAKMNLVSNPERSHEYLENAGRSMETAVNLTRQLLTFAKGGDPLREVLHIEDTIIETAQFSLLGSNIKLQTNVAPGLWEVEADKGQLNQVITNLVINAKQAMPEGGVVTITMENVTLSDGRYIQIIVQDKGTGITPQHLEKIFDPYFSTKQTGSGLGLASCHSIINNHNGSITAASELNEGTTFTILLPIAEAAKEADTDEKEMPISEAGPIPDTHILVLDDDENVRNVTGRMLKRMGYHVTFAAEGMKAIEEYRFGQYDAVITDLTLPGGMGGEKVAQEILELNPQARLIVSSGYATGSIMANYKSYGFKGRLVKPYAYEDLRKILAEVLK